MGLVRLLKHIYQWYLLVAENLFMKDVIEKLA